MSNTTQPEDAQLEHTLRADIGLLEWQILDVLAAIKAEVGSCIPKRYTILDIKLDEPSKSVEITRRQAGNKVIDTITRNAKERGLLE